MAKKSSKQKEDLASIQAAVAVHLHSLDGPCTTKQPVSNLAAAVKKLMPKTRLTIAQIAELIPQALQKWFEDGWATLNDMVLQVTRAGRAQTKRLAEMLTGPSAEPVPVYSA